MHLLKNIFRVVVNIIRLKRTIFASKVTRKKTARKRYKNTVYQKNIGQWQVINMAVLQI